MLFEIKVDFIDWKLEFWEKGEYEKKLPNVYSLMSKINREKINSWRYYKVLCILMHKCSNNDGEKKLGWWII